MNNTFTKKDLRSGYVVEFRNGARRLVTRAGNFLPILVNPDTRDWNHLNSCWADDLTCKVALFGELCHCECLNPAKKPAQYDIMKVWGLIHGNENYINVFTTDDLVNRDLLWERKEPKKLTVDEVSKLLGYEVEIVGTGR